MDEKKIHSIIDEAMAARDRSVSIYISPDGGISVSVFPWPDEETLRNMRASGLISHNDYRTRLGLTLHLVVGVPHPFYIARLTAQHLLKKSRQDTA